MRQRSCEAYRSDLGILVIAWVRVCVWRLGEAAVRTQNRTQGGPVTRCGASLPDHASELREPPLLASRADVGGERLCLGKVRPRLVVFAGRDVGGGEVDP
jgi:hypothetical protein